MNFTAPPQGFASRPRFQSRAKDVSPPDYSSLRDYQREGVDTIRRHRSFLLADAPRLGKSLQALRSLPKQCRAIVICPKSVRGVWQDEVTKWRPDLTATVTKELRRPSMGEVLISTWDNLPDPPRGSARLILDDLSDVYLIADEVHFCMSESAQRTQKFRALGSQCGHRLGLSGTPMPGTPPQLWGVLVSCGVALQAFPAGREEFVKSCGGTPKYIRDKRTGKLRQVGYNWGKVSPEVAERLKTVMLRRVASDVLDLPPKQYQDIRCETPADLRPFLDSVNEKAWEGVGPEDLPPFEVMAPARAALARSRIPEALEFARNMAASMPLIVFSAHVEPILAFRDVPGAGFVVGDESSHGKGDKSRQRTIDAFKQGELQIIAMTIKVGGVGLDLSRADGILFVDRAYNPGDNLQPEERATAVGKTSMVTIWRMVSDHPIDVRVQQIIDMKTRLQAALGV